MANSCYSFNVISMIIAQGSLIRKLVAKILDLVAKITQEYMRRINIDKSDLNLKSIFIRHIVCV